MTISELTAENRGDPVEVLAAAFHDYPIFRWELADVEGDDYDRQLRLLISFFVDARLMRGWPFLGMREKFMTAAENPSSPPV